MSLFRIEQQYIFNTDLQDVYKIYRSLWKKILIPREKFFAKEEFINEDEKKSLQKEIEDGYKVMYRQKDAIVIDFKTSRSTITKRIKPIELSVRFNTTAIDYSNWEAQSVVIATRGKIELSLFTDYNACLEIGLDYDPKFDELITKLEDVKGDQMFKLSQIGNLLGSDFENIFKIIDVDLISICQLDINSIQEAVTYGVFAK